jgi:hypothetical protein
MPDRYVPTIFTQVHMTKRLSFDAHANDALTSRNTIIMSVNLRLRLRHGSV